MILTGECKKTEPEKLKPQLIL